MKITFNEQEHTYLVDGKPYPNVTSILESAGYTNFKGIPRHILEYKRQLGTNVHLATKLFDEGILDEDSIGEAERPYFEGYKKFVIEIKPQFVEIEKPVASNKFRIVGTPDRIVIIDTKKGVLEFKCTAKLEPAAKVQTMAYFMSYNEMNPKDKCRTRWLLHLKDFDYDLVPCTKNTADKTAFLNALGVHNWKEINL